MSETPTLHPDTQTHLAAFQRGSVDLIDEAELSALISGALLAGRPLRVKFGMDPSSPDLHLGHAIPLLTLRDLQALGHCIVLIVGDATAMVGDPSGRNKLRPVLTREQVEANLVTYTDQAARVLDMDKTEVRRNSEWFDGMRFEDLLQLTTRMTVSQMLERDLFRRRLEQSEPIGINEFLYPLMQGWDSVEVDCDVELGGTDQLFNLLVGRRLQEQKGQRAQCVRTHPLIDGLDGRKMSKSYGNAVGLMDSARDMTFGVMRLDDPLMETWFTHLTRVPAEEVAGLLAGHPREAKARLAFEITSFFHSAEEAEAAARAFDREVRDKALPEDLPEHAWSGDWGASMALPNLIANLGLAPSTSQARRLIQQGAVRLDGEVVDDPTSSLAEPGSAVLLQVGKKRFARILPG
ncbi:MAG TPA: tyrosine--tRNA ligase [Planctomycetes bacterium]|nr:tyrosine--tRNA ligase [Planctomycetota bacterium]HIK61930.1 tyrosine--tRNA ligase [Planctomycetota bacterium]